jgi:DNA-binding transcriptional ArsR family regulator
MRRSPVPHPHRRRYPEPVTPPTEFLRLALDPERLAVLGHAAVGPVDIALLAKMLGVPQRRILYAAGRLRDAGLLTPDLLLDRGALRDTARALPAIETASVELTEGPWSADEVSVMARFFQGSRLTQIPAQRSKRLLVLERLSQEFEPGLRYPERQVDLILQVFHPDHATLRRHLVDEGYLTRADGVYWRTGGRVG